MEKSRKVDTSRLDQSRDARPTIGCLAFGISDDVGSAIWAGIADAAQKRDVNLICFVGEKLRDPNGFLAQANVLYDLVDPNRINGLVIWTSTIGLYVDHQEIVAFVEGYRPLPTVSLGMMLDGIPSIQIESYQGMREIMVHLIEDHGHRRLAFIRGPENHPYAQERYRAYTDTLAEYGLPIDPALITPPCDWSQSAGYDMVHLLLDQRGLQAGSDIEAIVAASDLFALGALEALQARSIKVPEEIGISGFNDSLEGRAVTPPLTSVAALFAKQGEQALEMVLAMLAGEQVPEQVALPSRLVVRQSCGCADSAVMQAKVTRSERRSDRPPTEAAEIIARVQGDILVAEMVQASAENLSPDQAERLVRAFDDEIEHRADNAFLATLEGILAQVVMPHGDAFAWQNTISVLRRNVLTRPGEDETSFRVENLLQQARVLAGRMTHRSQLYREVQAKQYNQTLRTIGQALIATFDVTRLRDILTKELPALGIPSCYLSVYTDPQSPTEEARLILAYDQTGHTASELSDERFRSSQLVPHSVWARKQRYTMIVTSLYFEENQLGLALFEMGPSDGATYDTLRGQISSALKGALLLQERQRAETALAQAYARVEEQVEERTRELQQEIAERRRAEEELQRYREHLEELVEERTQALKKAQAELVRQERLSALGQLTATVAHEIRNPLGTVRTSVFSIGDAMERDEMHRVERALQLAERNIVRCDTIITELLDYTRGRVLQLKPTYIDVWLDGVLDEVLDQRTIPEDIVCVRELEAQADASTEVMIDSEHMRRAIINVVNNAVDAMRDEVMRGAGDRPLGLSAPVKGEKLLTVSTQANGDRLEIRISDTGCGMPGEVKDRLFEPLFSTKSFGVGLGLSIVKAIMEQHGGGVEISSEPNMGTTVVLWLPIASDVGD